jgi:hypothetical protein
MEYPVYEGKRGTDRVRGLRRIPVADFSGELVENGQRGPEGETERPPSLPFPADPASGVAARHPGRAAKGRNSAQNAAADTVSLVARLDAPPEMALLVTVGTALL